MNTPRNWKSASRNKNKHLLLTEGIKVRASNWTKTYTTIYKTVSHTARVDWHKKWLEMIWFLHKFVYKSTGKYAFIESHFLTNDKKRDVRSSCRIKRRKIFWGDNAISKTCNISLNWVLIRIWCSDPQNQFITLQKNWKEPKLRIKYSNQIPINIFQCFQGSTSVQISEYGQIWK